GPRRAWLRTPPASSREPAAGPRAGLHRGASAADQGFASCSFVVILQVHIDCMSGEPIDLQTRTPPCLRKSGGAAHAYSTAPNRPPKTEMERNPKVSHPVDGGSGVGR